MRLAVVLLAAALGISICRAEDHAVALVYHHVSEDTPALTSVTPDTFAKHLAYLRENDFEVWPLGKILDAIEDDRQIPRNTVAITFDDAYLSVHTEAYRQLRAYGWPFTLFVNTEAIDQGYSSSMSWDQIRELARAGAEIGNHSHSHAHLVRRQDGESEAQWRRRVTADILRAEQRLRDEIGVKPTLFAYPFGEYSEELAEIVEDLDYRGVAQRSGTIGRNSDLLTVPRFPMSTGYANLQRFATSVNSRPLPVRSIRVAKPKPPNDRIDNITLKLDSGDYRIGQLACYSSRGHRLPSETTQGESVDIFVALDLEQPAGRNKINCTAPSASENGVYYWYSYQWLVKNPDGSWYRE